MAKLRLQIPGKNEIIMKNIIKVIIVDIDFNKDDYKAKDSRVLSNFYNFIKRNKNKITYISYREHSIDDYIVHMHLKDCEFHCDFEQAFYRLYGTFQLNFDNTYKNYYLNGIKLNYDDWKRKIRKIKLEKLNVNNASISLV
jgi:hypothetical protein